MSSSISRRPPKIIPCYAKEEDEELSSQHKNSNPRAYWNAMFDDPIPMSIIYDLLESCGSAKIVLDSSTYIAATHTEYRIMGFHQWTDIFATEVGRFYSQSYRDTDNVAPRTFNWWLTTLTRICRYNGCKIIRDKSTQRNVPSKLYIQI